MIREVRREEIPMCVEVIKKSFITVADEYGFTEENAPKFTAFATTTDRLDWHMDGEHRPILEKNTNKKFSFFDRRERKAGVESENEFRTLNLQGEYCDKNI